MRLDSGVGIKPISITGTKRLVRRGLRYALDHGLKTVTLVHKGNIMKFTEGAFRDWGYELAKQEFRQHVVTERESWVLEGKDKNPNASIEALAALRRAGLGNGDGEFQTADCRGSEETASIPSMPRTARVSGRARCW